ncbi:hypothetical protein MMC14_007952, partial [Varicellaria rhodocarpa]|nr:hypothetical protein [Varicellaria rhodocarpa]
MDMNLDEPLPLCDGPKLQPFEYRHAPVKFIRLLNAGDHGSVFEVLIESNTYALKIFNFYDPREEIGLADLNIPQELVIAHIDPFYAECRAYGRIEANGRNGNVA